MNTVSRTQIVATLGPSTKDRATIEALVAHQMDVARINMSWGTHEEDADIIRYVREAGEHAHRTIPIMLDLSGPRVQEGDAHHFAGSVSGVITEKDKADIAFGVAQHVEYFALSYVGGAKDVEELRALLASKGSTAHIIAKIERKEAVAQAAAIIAAADAVMVARGDLGNEVPLERIPFAQYALIQQANAAGKPVIVATEMLPSMVEHPVPTRSDVSDIVLAVMMGADAVMLSEESAIGKFPVEAVTMMEKIVIEAERHGATKTRLAF